MDVCLRVLRKAKKSRFDSYSVRNSVLIISHIIFRDCRVHISSDNLSQNSCIIGSLSNDVFERRTSTGSEAFSLLISLDAATFVLLSVLTLIETICPKICSKSRLKSAKSPLPVDPRRSKTSLLKLPNVNTTRLLYSTLGTRGFFLACDEELLRPQADPSSDEGRRHERRTLF